MNHEEIAAIERGIGIELPDSYKQIMLNYPEALLESDAQDYGLLNDAEVIIEENTDVRKNGYFGEPWPERYFIIGINGMGDYFVINHQEKEFQVGFADHEAMACTAYAQNLPEFIQKYLAEYE